MTDIFLNIESQTYFITGGVIFLILVLYIIFRSADNRGVKITTVRNQDEIIEEGQVNIGNTHRDTFNLNYKDFSKFCLIFGSTGSGKTVTIKNIVSKFISGGYPVIYVDGKPSDSVVEFLKNQTPSNFYGFNCHDFHGYDFLRGTPSEVKDRIICIKDQWESDYYKTVSSDYIQLVLKYLSESENQITLDSILKLLNIKEFLKVLRNSKSDLIHKVIYFSDNVKESELKGLYSHLSLVLNSDFGGYLDGTKKDSINLEEVINSNAVAYFALPALKFPEFSSFIGKVVINDIKSTIEKVRKPVLIIFDEFSVFAGSQVLNLINQGREFGAHTIVGTQSVEDLKEWSSQIINNANLMITHRVHSNITAEEISKFFGTKSNIEVTRQLRGDGIDGTGSFKRSREFHVHPDTLKTLNVGECYINIKDKHIIQKVQINNL